MMSFGDIAKILPHRSCAFSAKELDHLRYRAAQEMVRRAIPGLVIVPLCLLLAVVTSRYYHESRTFCLLLLGAMTVGMVLRGWGMKSIADGSPQGLPPRLRLFSVGCLVMAAAWGSTVAVFLVTYGAGFPVLLVFILSAGIGAGIVANFCLWRGLAVGFLLLAFIPGIVAGLFLAEEGMWPVIVAMLFFVVYVNIQINHWHRDYWESLVTAYLFEQQAIRLVDTNTQLEELVEREQAIRLEVEAGREKMQALFDFAHDGILISDFSGSIVDVNQTLLTMLQLPKNQVVTMQVQDLLVPSGHDGEPTTLAPLWQTVVAGGERNFEAKLAIKADPAGYVYVEVNMKRVLWQQEDIVFFSMHDISAKKRAETVLSLTQKSLSKSEGYLQAILRNVELPMYCKDRDGRYLTVNQAFLSLSSLADEEIKGKDDLEIFPENLGHFFSFRDGEVLSSGESIEIEGTFNFGGVDRNILIHKFALREDDGRIYATAGICSDVTTVKKALHTAQVANEAKAEFLANMSHELRTPMHSILSFARLGLKRVESGSREKLKSYFEMIIRSGDQLLKLLSDLLDLNTLESNHAVYSFKQYDLGEDLAKVVEEFRAMMDERRIRLEFDRPRGRVRATYDQTKLFQVVRNLLANAIKFTADGREVRIVLQQDHITSGRERRDAWKVMVVDQGVGIEKEELEMVFGRFIQGTRTKSGAGGVGLGLSICKRIIEDHQGRIWAEQNDHGGSTFIFMVPADNPESS